MVSTSSIYHEKIGSEFLAKANFTVPNADPVFFLHHAQLDRLWWKWQQEKPERLREYNGESAHRSGINASLQDQLEMGGLAPAVAVEQVIETKAGLLCYEYAY